MLQDPIAGYVVPVDPEAAKAYEYRATGARSFELCATFSQKSIDPVSAQPVKAPGSSNEVWVHGVGRTCFVRTIDPQLYPPAKSIN
jgi:hypothetical protein